MFSLISMSTLGGKLPVEDTSDIKSGTEWSCGATLGESADSRTKAEECFFFFGMGAKKIDLRRWTACR